MRNKFIIYFGLFVLLLSSCTVINRQGASQVEPEKTQLQTRQYQTREFDTNDVKLVMKAVVNTLQDDGFIIKNAVVDLGLISATKEIDLKNTPKKETGSDFWEGFFRAITKTGKTYNPPPGEVTYNKLKVVEATLNVSEFGKQTKVRASFIAKILDNKGNPVEVYNVDDMKFYQDFFAKVDKGVFLQKSGL